MRTPLTQEMGQEQVTHPPRRSIPPPRAMEFSFFRGLLLSCLSLSFVVRVSRHHSCVDSRRVSGRDLAADPSKRPAIAEAEAPYRRNRRKGSPMPESPSLVPRVAADRALGFAPSTASAVGDSE